MTIGTNNSSISFAWIFISLLGIDRESKGGTRKKKKSYKNKKAEFFREIAQKKSYHKERKNENF
jgi:hypothetical protein